MRHFIANRDAGPFVLPEPDSLAFSDQVGPFPGLEGSPFEGPGIEVTPGIVDAFTEDVGPLGMGGDEYRNTVAAFEEQLGGPLNVDQLNTITDRQIPFIGEERRRREVGTQAYLSREAEKGRLEDLTGHQSKSIQQSSRHRLDVMNRQDDARDKRDIQRRKDAIEQQKEIEDAQDRAEERLLKYGKRAQEPIVQTGDAEFTNAPGAQGETIVPGSEAILPDVERARLMELDIAQEKASAQSRSRQESRTFVAEQNRLNRESRAKGSMTELTKSTITNLQKQRQKIDSASSVINLLRQHVQPGNIGLVGMTKKLAQDVAAQAREVVGEIKSQGGSVDIDIPRWFDPELSKVDTLRNILAYQLASARKNRGWPTDKDVARATDDIGLGSLLSNPSDMMARLDIIEEALMADKGRIESELGGYSQGLIGSGGATGETGATQSAAGTTDVFHYDAERDEFVSEAGGRL